jgi:P4 family phage/plasmid primase-like protien
MTDFDAKEKRALESIEKLKQPIEIPAQLRQPDFGFVLLTPRDKRPIEKDWTNIVRRFDDAVLLEHIKNGGNYGVRCGFGGLNVIDADTKEVRECAERLGETFVVQTGGGGRHYYVLCPELNKKIILFDKDKKHLGEIQSTGTQVVAPTCWHPSGNRYVVLSESPIKSVGKEQLLTVFSEYLEKTEKLLTEESDITFPIAKLIDAEKFIKHGDELQGTHPVHGSDTGQNFCVNVKKNMWHCFRCNTGGGVLSLIAVLEGLVECKDVRAGALKPKWRELVKIANEKYGLKIEDINLDNFFQIGEDGKRHWYPEGAFQEISKFYTFVKVAGDKSLYYYEGGIWRENGEEVVASFVSEHLPEKFRSQLITELVTYIRGKCFSGINLFDTNKNLICLENGVLDIDKKELMEWSPTYHLTTKLPVKYDKDAMCLNTMKFLGEVMTEQDKENMIEMIGYCLYRDMPIHKSFMLVGDGANGKSTLINVIKNFLGRDNVVSIPLQRITKDRFSLTSLINKLANLYADLPSEAIQHTGTFKMMTGNDVISAEKKFGGFTNFTNYAKFIFSCNQVPDAKDDTGAFFRRWIIINFPNKFEGDKADKNLLQTLVTEGELSGLLNLVLNGLTRLLEKGDFSFSQTTDEMRERYIRLASPVKAFVMDCIDSDTEGEVAKDTLYQNFILYCQKNNYPTMPSNTFSSKLKEVVQPLGEGQVRGGGTARLRVWRGIKLREMIVYNDSYKLSDTTTVSINDDEDFVNYL